MTVQDMIDELSKVENKSLEIMIGINSQFSYIDAEDLGVTTFGLPCDEFGMPLEDGIELGPTVFTIAVMNEDMEMVVMDDEDDDK